MQQRPDILAVEWRGRERYSLTWDYQLRQHARRRAGEIGDVLILVEHEPVITLGRHGDMANLLIGEGMLKERGVEFHRVERGGDITYHGPGQLVGYPIIDLKARGITVRQLMRGLEEALIRTLADCGISAERQPGLTGVWRGSEKLASLGVAVKNGISYHGFALNVSTDLSYFELIVPCGITDKRITSASLAGGRALAVDELRQPVAAHLADVFGYDGMISM
jgi:lipoate-protein ligase B